MISIHAPREGSDGDNVLLLILHAISIHAPREGSDLIKLSRRSSKALFQSTLPARGATPPSPTQLCRAAISIHAPREGSDVALVALVAE